MTDISHHGKLCKYGPTKDLKSSMFSKLKLQIDKIFIKMFPWYCRQNDVYNSFSKLIENQISERKMYFPSYEHRSSVEDMKTHFLYLV